MVEDQGEEKVPAALLANGQQRLMVAVEASLPWLQETARQLAQESSRPIRIMRFSCPRLEVTYLPSGKKVLPPGIMPT